MTQKSPVQRQRDEYGSKDKLVDRIVLAIGQIAKIDDKEAFKGRLLAASNKKLLHLVDVATEIKEKFGSVDKLAEAAASALGRAKDAPYVAKLKAFTPSRLLDTYRTAQKRTKKSAA